MGRDELVPAATAAAIHRCGAQERVPVLIDDFGTQSRIHRVSPPLF
jgi:hypothetical protein